jgi:hypothetical protein
VAVADDVPTPERVVFAVLGKVQLYMNRGVGMSGIAFRLNSPPEVTLATLRRLEPRPALAPVEAAAARVEPAGHLDSAYGSCFPRSMRRGGAARDDP